MTKIKNAKKLFYSLWFGRPMCVIVPNFIKIGGTIAEIWQYNGFLKWRPPPSWIYWTCTWTTHEEYSVVELLCAERRKMYARCLIVILVLLALAQILPRGVEACSGSGSKSKSPDSKTASYPNMRECKEGTKWRMSCCSWCDKQGKREKCTCKHRKHGNPISCECLYR